ncbi:MAG: tetratricopeptide repeat protein [Eubacteriales bacterium]|nr:tetratricopeptide repeat protein [Eubacteriales bacterium]
MGLNTTLKVRKAVKAHNEGHTEEAMKLYEECMSEGLKDVRYLLAYSVLLVRSGDFAKAREVLVQIQKYPMKDDQKRQLYVNYAVCVYKMGEIEKALELLERQSQKNPSGLTYETLGYLYVEQGDFDKALAYNTEALEYDDEDSIVLDNLGQTWYRLGNDKGKAKEYFEKALEQKPGQIDTLYFLAQYDIEAGKKDAAREKLEKALEGKFSPLNYATKQRVQDLLKQL